MEMDSFDDIYALVEADNDKLFSDVAKMYEQEMNDLAKAVEVCSNNLKAEVSKRDTIKRVDYDVQIQQLREEIAKKNKRISQIQAAIADVKRGASNKLFPPSTAHVDPKDVAYRTELLLQKIEDDKRKKFKGTFEDIDVSCHLLINTSLSSIIWTFIN